MSTILYIYWNISNICIISKITKGVDGSFNINKPGVLRNMYQFLDCNYSKYFPQILSLIFGYGLNLKIQTNATYECILSYWIRKTKLNEKLTSDLSLSPINEQKYFPKNMPR